MTSEDLNMIHGNKLMEYLGRPAVLYGKFSIDYGYDQYFDFNRIIGTLEHRNGRFYVNTEGEGIRIRRWDILGLVDENGIYDEYRVTWY